jgi:small conductance mechanosensitive channel
MPDLNELSRMVQEYLVPWGINVALALVILIVGRWVVKYIIKGLHKILERTKIDTMLVDFISSIANTVLLLFVIIAAVDQLGVDTTSLIALIGAAGLAIGMALQGSLQNFAAGVMLIVFRPFRAGDFIEAGGTTGVVEEVSIFHTELKTPDNRTVIVPNNQIYGGTITNYSARKTRRVDMVFGIGYNDDIKKAKDILWEIINSDERILKDPAPMIVVGELGDSSVNFNVRPWVKTSDYWDVLFDITEKVKLAFDENGISIPFPQMDVHMETLSSN